MRTLFLVVAVLVGVAPAALIFTGVARTPSGFQYRLIFGGAALVSGLLSLGLVWFQNTQIAGMPPTKIVRWCVGCLVGFLLFLILLYFGFDYCVVQTQKDEWKEYGPVYFPLWLKGEVAQLQAQEGSRMAAIDAYGPGDVDEKLDKMPGITFARTVTTVVLCLILVAVSAPLPYGFGLLAFYVKKAATVTELLPISGCQNFHRAGDVVFVHGLDGDAQTTWFPEGRPDDFWPGWLGADFPHLGVWSLGYAINSSAWRGHSLPLTERATNRLALLSAKGFGEKPIVWVCHSFGGLLVKQMLRHLDTSLGEPTWKTILDRTRGIVFLSTPHHGSDLASYMSYLKHLLRNTVTIKELKAHEPHLRELNLWFRRRVGALNIKIQVYYEKLPVFGILVVNETSADPGITDVIPIPMEDTHITICKPASREGILYRRVKQFLKECLGAGEESTISIPTAGAAANTTPSSDGGK